MKLFFVSLLILGAILPMPVRADMFGGDIPLLAEIVANTLQTLYELERQTGMMNDDMAGITDKISRIQTIAEIVQPSTWNQWKDPTEALRRLKSIYYTLPKEYHSDKSVLIEEEISKAMSMVSELSPGSRSAFLSGKEMEKRGADASPGVAQKMTASGVGSLVALTAQTQIIESHITSLLAQSLALANEREARSVATQGHLYSGVATSLYSDDDRFSTQALSVGLKR